MSRCSWRSAEALHERRRTQRAIQRADERAQLRRKQANEEWHITGEPAFCPKERNYPHGGGIDGATFEGFLSSAERAIHLHDRYVHKCCDTGPTCYTVPLLWVSKHVPNLPPPVERGPPWRSAVAVECCPHKGWSVLEHTIYVGVFACRLYSPHCCTSRGKTLTREMSVTLASLEQRNKALVEACEEFCDKHSSHLHPDRT